MPRPTIRVSTRVTAGVLNQTRRGVNDIRSYIVIPGIADALNRWREMTPDARQELLNSSPVFASVLSVCNEVADKVRTI